VGGVEGGEGARGDVAVLVEEGSVHVDCDEADGGHGGCGYCIGEALTIVRSTLLGRTVRAVGVTWALSGSFDYALRSG
jgi:hypothetical protein